MEAALLVLSGIAAVSIVYQDFTTRRVAVWPLMMIGILGFIHAFVFGTIARLEEVLINIGLIGVIVGAVYLYFKVKGHKQVMDVLLGWGDVVMLVALAAWFPSDAFLIFYTAVTMGAIMITLVAKLLLRSQQDPQIPLAAYLALGFQVWILMILFI